MAYQDKPPLDEIVAKIIVDEEIDAQHYGMPKRSGRYPYGSGENPYQHSGDFLARVNELKKSGMSESDIAKTLGIVNRKGEPSSTRLRTQLSLAKNEERALKVATAKGLREKGYSLNEIAREMGFKNDSSVRSLLNEKSAVRMSQAEKTAEFLKKQVKEKGMLDVGTSVERELNVSSEKLNQALYILEMEGYHVYGGRMPQPTNPKQQTTIKVLCPPGTKHKEIYDYSKINSVKDYITRDGGETYEKKFHYPSSMDSKRLMVRYKEDGGIEKDGIIELRRGVEDLSLGNSRYSQVRILVDGTKYLKGMAVYSDDMPDGVDVIFNTNKSKSVSKMDVLKDVKRDRNGNIDQDNPFGSLIKDADQGGQYWYTDKSGQKKLGLINKRSDEGDWSDWSDKLPSQFLSKQSTTLAKRQLGLAIKDKVDEYNSIVSLNNPTVKKKLLQDFSDNCDSAAVHLYAAALPRQKYHVIIPISSLKDTEIYAPRYKDGEKVALIRYPHGGTFEIPILTVNNKHAKARKLLGTDILDAVGINKNVADRLSGADFDGDTVMVIPTNSKVKIKSTTQLKGLEGFDPKMSYGTIRDGDDYYNANGQKIKVMKNTQNEMGRISNLITDMTLKGANEEELARAVRHSMVVIDAEKHKLDYKQSALDNGIDSLKKKYQEGGASTLISRAKSQDSVPKRQGTPHINLKGNKDYDPTRPEGAYIYKNSDDLYYPARSRDKNTGIITLRTVDGKKITYDPSNKKEADKYEPIKKVDSDGTVSFTNKKGDITYRTKIRKEPSTLMEETDDATTLISNMNTPMERIYADYANKMKTLANQARKEMATTGKIEYSKKAKEVYREEVESINSKLDDALRNKPRERQAIAIANTRINAKKQDNPDMTKEELKKVSQQELTRARQLVGAERTTIKITDKEWEAIQAGAVSETTLKRVLDNADIDVLREKATPRITKTLSSSQKSRISAMRSSGLTIEQIANALGISSSTVTKYLQGKE